MTEGFSAIVSLYLLSIKQTFLTHLVDVHVTVARNVRLSMAIYLSFSNPAQ